MSSTPKIYLLLLNYNGWRDTQECLESVLHLDYSNYQIIVVDNCSSNNSMSHLLAWVNGEEDATVDNSELTYLSAPITAKPINFVFYDENTALQGGIPSQESILSNPIVFIQASENRGFAAGNNVGMKYAIAKGDAHYIWCLNNDTVVEPNALTELLKKAQFYKDQEKKIGIIGAKLMYYHFPKLIQAVGGKYNKWLATSKHIGAFHEDNGQFDTEDVTNKISYPVGASMFVDINFIKDVGLMCEDYFLYYEELDWVYRGHAKNWQVGYCWQARVYHKEGGSTGGSCFKTLERSQLADYYSLRNRIIFTKKSHTHLLLIVKLSFLLVLINRFINNRSNTIKAVLRAISEW